ncbi:benzoate/H(+) symporter BenE family transporter [Actinomycetota bacterium]
MGLGRRGGDRAAALPRHDDQPEHPHGLIESVAGLALIATFAAAAASALGDAEHREAAAITFLVAASGLHLAGIGAAFWGLVAGGVFLLVMRRRRGRHASAR